MNRVIIATLAAATFGLSACGPMSPDATDPTGRSEVKPSLAMLGNTRDRFDDIVSGCPGTEDVAVTVFSHWVVSQTVDADGARHGVLNSTSDSVHSGFLQAGPQDRAGLAQASPGVTRFRVTFSKPGIYPYICALHDGLGMKGKVVVLP